MEEFIKIATWNISCGISIDWDMNTGKGLNNNEKRSFIDEIVEIINRENIDIIALQETIINNQDKKGYNEYISQKTKLKYYTEFDTSECHLIQDSRIGISILSKFPIIQNNKELFYNPKFKIISKSGKEYISYDNGLITSKIKIDNKEVIFITAHLLPFKRFNKKEEECSIVFKELENKLLKCV